MSKSCNHKWEFIRVVDIKKPQNPDLKYAQSVFREEWQCKHCGEKEIRTSVAYE